MVATKSLILCKISIELSVFKQSRSADLSSLFMKEVSRDLRSKACHDFFSSKHHFLAQQYPSPRNCRRRTPAKSKYKTSHGCAKIAIKLARAINLAPNSTLHAIASLHVQWTVLAAQKQKHVLLEKPVALDVGDLDKILEACVSNGVQFLDGSILGQDATL